MSFSRLFFAAVACGLLMVGGCGTHQPHLAKQTKPQKGFPIEIDSDADWFAVTIDPLRSDARFVLPEEPGIWIVAPQPDIKTLKFSKASVHVHRRGEARGMTKLQSFYIQSSRPDVYLRIQHGANGKVVVTSQCDTVITTSKEMETRPLHLCPAAK